MIVNDYLDEVMLIRQGKGFSAAGNVLGTVANPANIVLFNTSAVALVLTRLSVTTDVVSSGQLFRLTADPALAAGNAIQNRGNAGAGSLAAHEFAVAVSPGTAGLFGAFRSGPTQIELINKGAYLSIIAGRGFLLQWPALAINISYTWDWYELPS